MIKKLLNRIFNRETKFIIQEHNSQSNKLILIIDGKNVPINSFKIEYGITNAFERQLTITIDTGCGEQKGRE